MDLNSPDYVFNKYSSFAEGEKMDDGFEKLLTTKGAKEQFKHLEAMDEEFEYLAYLTD